MNICVPVEVDRGLDSPVCAHFGSAPGFVIVDTESDACRYVRNINQHHEHGHCQPLASLAGEQIDGMLVGDIGRGALARLQAAHIDVFRAQQATVHEAVTAYKSGSLATVDPARACGQHRHHHGHGRAS